MIAGNEVPVYNVFSSLLFLSSLLLSSAPCIVSPSRVAEVAEVPRVMSLPGVAEDDEPSSSRIPSEPSINLAIAVSSCVPREEKEKTHKTQT